MVRKLAGVVFAVSTLHASVVSALGLGEMELKSGLNQPMVAEIALNNIGDLNEQQIAVKLAGTKDFERAGVERVFFLNDLKFAVQLDGKGSGIVKISSKKLVREPYLDFVLEARWPTGRLLREYTVLVDLPVFSDKAVAAPAAAVNTQASQGRSSTPTRARVPAPAANAAAIQAAAPASASGEIVSQKSDTLWRLASRTRPAGASMQQTMMAIYRNNPHAFARQNINGLRSGKVLRLPSAEQIEQLSKQQAIQAVAMQNEAWKKGSAAPLEAADTTVEQTAQAQVPAESYMKLSNAAGQQSSAAGSSAGTDEGADIEAVRSELNLAQEKLDRANLENQELDGRLSDLAGQIETLEKLVELKDTQLASMQGRLEQQESAPEAAPVDQNFASEADAQAEDAAGELAGEAEPGLMDRLMSPLYLGGIGALVMLAVAGLVMRRRAAAEADDEGDWQEQVEVAQATESSDDTAAVFAALTEEPAAAMDQHAELEQEPEAEVDGLDEAVTAVAEQADSKAEPTDPLAEAEVYCSYDRHDEAIAMLQKALEQDPGRTEIQLKIMAIYADLDRESDFMKAYDSLAADGNDDSLQLAQQLVAAKGWLDDTSVADPVAEAPDLTVETPSATDAGEIGDEIADVELDFDLDFDLSDVESLDNTEQNTVLDLALDNLNLDDDDAGLEFDLNLDDETPEAEAADSEQGADATVLADMLDADGDLDDDLSEMVDGDEIATKLDLARAYVDMGDVDGARDILDEVLQEGSEVQVEEANSLLRNIAS